MCVLSVYNLILILFFFYLFFSLFFAQKAKYVLLTNKYTPLMPFQAGFGDVYHLCFFYITREKGG